MLVRHLGIRPYQQTWDAMRRFVAAADEHTEEEIWCLQHPAVYTLGRAGKKEHLLQPVSIPVIHTDRGGQITYHGEGQLVCYTMLNIARRACGLRELVRTLEQAVIETLAHHRIRARGDTRAPGVYVDDAKIAALGLRVSRGWTYHGISVNISMDLSPFAAINPCGYPGLRVTQLKDFYANADVEEECRRLADALVRHLAPAAR